jgi:uncharacterized membrane protein YhaH (DUF805 family)
MKALFKFQGRSNREDWWIFAALPSVALGTAAQVLEHSTHDAAQSVHMLCLALRIAGFSLWLPCTVRRLHDTDRSGWYSLIALIPLLGGLWILYVCGIQRGNEAANQFGPVSS